jgi:hypothetical protein
VGIRRWFYAAHEIAHYSDEDHERFAACALALRACRVAGRRVLEQTMLLPVLGSKGELDLRELQGRRPRPPDNLLTVVMGSTVGPHVYAAAEYLGALSLLYEHEEIHLAPMVLARTTIEHCAQALWILGSADATCESRVARALLNLINGLEQVEQYAARFRGEDSAEYRRRNDLTETFRADAHLFFPPPYELRVSPGGRKRPALGNEHLPSHTQIVVRAVGLMRTSLDEKQALGTYGLLSASVHATPNEIVEMVTQRDESDPASISLTRDRRTHEPLVRMLVSFFYSALSHAMSYSGIKSPDHDGLGTSIQEYLPGHFGDGPMPGPFDH